MGNFHYSNERLLLKSALILTVAGIITKVLSAAYRIPFQNIVGDIGFYIYQQVYPFYGIALVLSTYGFPVIISKIIAEQRASNGRNITKVLMTSFLFLSIIFIAIFIGIYKGSLQIAALMGDTEIATPLKVVAFSFLFVPIVSVLRGYFQGVGNMIPTAISQIGEQSIRVATILLFSFLLVANGYSNYIVGAGAIFGSITGGFCAGIILLYFLKKKKLKLKNELKSTSNSKSSSIIWKLSGQGLTICVSSLFLILIQLVDAMTLYSLLVKSGVFSITEAKVVKGVFDRGQPLIQLGTVVATSLSLTLVPLISSAKVRNDFQFIRDKVHLSIRISVVVGVGASFGLIGIIKPTNIMLFKTIDGSNVLAILAITILFSSITMTAAALIQGLGQSWLPATFIIIGIFGKIVLNYLLIPSFGTLGAAVATVVAFIMTTFFILRSLSSSLEMSLIAGYFLKVLVSGACMLGFLLIYQAGITEWFAAISMGRVFATFQALSGVCLGGVVYIFIVLKMRIFSEQEVATLPFAGSLRRVINQKNEYGGG